MEGGDYACAKKRGWTRGEVSEAEVLAGLGGGGDGVGGGGVGDGV